MLFNSFLKETQKQKWEILPRKTEFIQKIKDIFGFSFKESSTAKPRRLKVTEKMAKHTIIVTQVKHDWVNRGGFIDFFHRLHISRTPQLWHAGSHWTCKVRFHVHSGFHSKGAGVWTQKRERNIPPCFSLQPFPATQTSTFRMIVRLIVRESREDTWRWNIFSVCHWIWGETGSCPQFQIKF